MFFFGCCFTAFWYIAMDCQYFLLVIFGLDTTVNRFNLAHSEQAKTIKLFNEIQKEDDNKTKKSEIKKKSIY